LIYYSAYSKRLKNIFQKVVAIFPFITYNGTKVLIPELVQKC